MLWGTLGECVAVVVLVVMLLGSRHPKQPKWAGDIMVQYGWVIAILGLAATGVVLMAFAFSRDAAPITIQEYLWSLAVASGTAILLNLSGIKKKLAAYAASRQAA
jgi:hypothetical protein